MSVVILAQSFNPTIFNQHWLVSNKFINEANIEPTSIFSQNLANIITPNYNLLVLPEQLQFNSITESVTFNNDILCTLVPIIEKISETPFKAVGINFNWFIKDNSKSMQVFTKELFFNTNSKLFSEFDSDDSRFGAYMSKNFNNTRLKLDIKPVQIINNITDHNISEYLNYNFNFHLDLNQIDTAVIDLVNTIKAWESFKFESEKIVELI